MENLKNIDLQAFEINIDRSRYRQEFIPEIINSHEYKEYSFRQWQREATKKQRGQKYTITNVLMGSGKSIHAQHLGLYLIKKRKATKLIYCVPQTQIGHSFKDEKLINGLKWEPEKSYFLCDNNRFDNIENTFVNFFKSNHFILICTHQALVRGWSIIKEFLNSNVHIFIDEAHHIKATGIEDYENRLGNVCSDCLNKGSGLHLLTATPYRGDKFPLIDEKHKHLFTVGYYHLSFYESLKDIKSFDSIGYRFKLIENAEYRYSYEMGKVVEDDVKKKTIIYLPSVNSVWNGGKHKDVENIIKSIARVDAVPEEDENGVIHINGLKFINLVDEKNRNIKKDYIGDGKNLDVDYILALNMFREGYNWDRLERVIICGPRGSENELVQIFGRPLRDLGEGNKKNPEVIHILSKPGGKTDEELKESINQFALQYHFTLQMEMDFGGGEYEDKNGSDGGGGERVDYIRKLVDYDHKKCDDVLMKLWEILIRNDKDGEAYKKEAVGYLGSIDCCKGYINGAVDQYLKLWEKRKKVFVEKNPELAREFKLVEGSLTEWLFRINRVNLERVRGLYKLEGKASLEEHIKFAKERNYTTCKEWNAAYLNGEIPSRFYSFSTYFYALGWIFLDIKPYTQPKTKREHILHARKEGLNGPTKWENSDLPDGYIRFIRTVRKEWMEEMFPNKQIKDRNISDKIKRLWDNGKSTKEIVNLLKCSQSQISFSLRKKGISRSVKDLEKGQKFGDYEVVRRNGFKQYGKNEIKQSLYLCKSVCCGDEKSLPRQSLLRGKGVNCLCKKEIIEKKRRYLIAKSYEFIDALGKVFAVHNLSEYIRNNGSGVKNIMKKRDYSWKGICLHHPKLVGTTHQERIEKGLYKKYIKLSK